MAATCLDRCNDDDTSVHLCIACSDEHILYRLKSHENLELQMIPEELLNEKSEERRFTSRSLCKTLGRSLRRSKFAIQKRTERRGVAFREQVERSKSSFKKRISASKELMSQLGKRIQKRFVMTGTKLRHICGRKRGMKFHPFESVNHTAIN